ncbi:MAG TPA: sigma-70 family RNA polymerase sigma factor [Anaerolineaceae bacterium]
MDTEQALLAAREPEPLRLGELHDRFYPVVYRYVRFRLEDEQVCEDITAEAFLRLVDALNRQKTAVQNPRAWLLGTASHLIADHLRARYRRPTSSLDEIEIAGASRPEEEIEQGAAHRSVRAAILRLTQEQQHVLALRFAEDFSLEETARLMGKTTGAVKTLQFRALGALRKLLALENWE